MGVRRRLSALVVNYDSGAFAVRCLESLEREWLAAGRAREDLELVVVENASPRDQEPFLARMQELGARIVRSETNRGYAGGMNLALASSTGGSDDVVAVLNPDLFFLPGSVAALMDYVEAHSDLGAIDPRACIDPLGVVDLPPNLTPGLVDRALVTAAHMSPSLCRLYSRRRTAVARRYWEAEQPIESAMLSGCCLFLRRSVIERLGDFMDERFPLYFEDTDLFLRLRRLGLRLVHHGGAKVLHHWSRSAGVGGELKPEPLRRYLESQRAYFEKHHGRLGLGWLALCDRLEARRSPAKLHRPMFPLQELGERGDDPVEIPLPRASRFLLELAVDPTWIVACGIFGSGDLWRCPPETWEWWFQADYFLRGIDLDTGAHLGAWHVRKTTPGRSTPLEAGELEHLGERIYGGRAVPGAAHRRAVGS